MTTQVLIVYLRITAMILLSAAAAVVLPFAWMNAIHGWLGLGELPNTPMVNYLARSLSALYAATGAIYAFASTDVRRYLPLLRLTALVKIAFGICMFVLDLSVGMPWFWTAIEGPVIVIYSGVLVWLTYRVEQSP